MRQKKVLSVLLAEYKRPHRLDRKSTRLNSSHSQISYAVFCLKKKKKEDNTYAKYTIHNNVKCKLSNGTRLEPYQNHVQAVVFSDHAELKKVKQSAYIRSLADN